MTYNTKAISNLILERGRESFIRIDPMKLQKLVYFTHGWHLALKDEPLISEPIEAWDYGPVVESLYREFKRYGNQIIDGFATAWDSSESRLITPILSIQARSAIEPLIQRMFEVYGKYTAVALSNMTHVEGSPWEQARRNNPGRQNVIIGNDSIKEYFKAQMGRA